MSAAQTPPKGLQAAGRALWRDVLAAYELRPDERIALSAACRCADELARLEAALKSADVVTIGSKGQPVAHPLFEEVRRHRVTLSRLLGVVGLAEVDGTEDERRAAAGRALAATRWSRGA